MDSTWNAQDPAYIFLIFRGQMVTLVDGEVLELEQLSKTKRTLNNASRHSSRPSLGRRAPFPLYLSIFHLIPLLIIPLLIPISHSCIFMVVYALLSSFSSSRVLRRVVGRNERKRWRNSSNRRRWFFHLQTAQKVGIYGYPRVQTSEFCNDVPILDSWDNIPFESPI